MTDLLLEEVGRRLLLTVRENLNDHLDDVWNEMSMKDALFYAEMGQPMPDTPKRYPVNFYLGHHPEILDYPIDDYPNVTCMCYEHNPVGEFQGLDQIEELRNRAYVEAFVVHPDAETVNRLAWRYAKALHRVLTEHKSLDNYPTIWEMTRSPVVTVSSSVARRVSEWKDEWTYVQGCRLEYIYQTPQPW
jgi:hypothetical protein